MFYFWEAERLEIGVRGLWGWSLVCPASGAGDRCARPLGLDFGVPGLAGILSRIFGLHLFDVFSKGI